MLGRFDMVAERTRDAAWPFRMGKSALSSVDWWHAHRAAGDRRRRFARVGPGRAAAAVRCARGRLPRQLRRAGRRWAAPEAAALIAFAPDGRLPAREDLAHHGLPVLALYGDGDEDTGGEDFRLQSTPGVDTRLRDIVLSGRLAGPAPDPDGGEVLAVADSGPAWTASAGAAPVHRVRAALRRARRRRAAVRAARRSARSPRSPSSTSCARSRRPPAGARRRCGRRCTSTTRTCAGAATASSTTASCSSTPTRTATTSPWRRSRSTPGAPTARRRALFRERPDRLSLVFHGNDHIKGELMAPKDVAAATAVAAQALRRVERFERRSRPARRPRHDAAARDVLRAHDARSRRPRLRRARGHLSAPVDRSLPVRPAAGGLAPGGLGRRLRRHPAHPAELERRRHRAARLPRPPGRRSTPTTRTSPGASSRWRRPRRRSTAWATCDWMSMGEIAASNGDRRLAGDARRRAAVRAPPAPRGRAGARTLRVQAPADAAGRRRAGGLVGRRRRRPAFGADVPWQGNGHVEIRLRGARDLDARDVAAPAWRPWPKLRRAATEARDRLLPLRP